MARARRPGDARRSRGGRRGARRRGLVGGGAGDGTQRGRRAGGSRGGTGSRRGGRARPVRVYMDGCFDMMHYGHCNALRQARALGDELIVGVVSDDEITANKGPPVTPLHERLIMVRAVKWVHDVIPDAPYAITEDFMNKLFNEYNIDYIIHGDDPCLLPDGTDAYALAKKGPGPDSRIVYIDGAFDLFHAGHVEVNAMSNVCLSM
uniref:ethanolamine-phosphate cytidylyltransferase n=1 Tax=Oryza glumipatula TaxID=40148 RepID=A0A0E0BEP6_9ORYZ